ncbi:MAG: pilus assembly protein PilM [Bacteroidales bacterium]|nr:pilus assembly protein PilM [Bacteroidales bacterium]
MSTLIYSIDLGTIYSRIVVAEQDDTQVLGLKTIHLDEVPSYGIKRGQVYNVEDVTRTVRSLFSNVEKKLPKKYASAKRAYCININGLQFKGGYMSKDIDVSSKQRIDERDVRHILDLQKNDLKVQKETYIINIEPIAFSIDGMPETSSAIGISGNMLRCNSYVITAPQKNISLLKNCLPTITLNQVYTTASAKARVLLPSSTRNKCVALIDIGAGVINIAICKSGVTRYEISIPLGTSLITSDLANELNLSIKEAEVIKQNMNNIFAQQGTELSIKFSEDNIVTLNSKELKYIALARTEELVAYIESALQKSNLLPSIDYIYVTGGGSKTYGIIDCIKKRLENKLVSLCNPAYDGYDSNTLQKYAAAIGMAMLYIKNNPSLETAEIPFVEAPPVTNPEPKPEDFKLTPPEPAPKKPEEKKSKFKTFLDFASKIEAVVTGGEESDDTLK